MDVERTIKVRADQAAGLGCAGEVQDFWVGEMSGVDDRTIYVAEKVNLWLMEIAVPGESICPVRPSEAQTMVVGRRQGAEIEVQASDGERLAANLVQVDSKGFTGQGLGFEQAQQPHHLDFESRWAIEVEV